MLEGPPALLSTELVGFRDQRFALSFLGVLSDRELWTLLHYYQMTDSEIDSVRRWRDIYLGGNRTELAALLIDDGNCGCGDWSA
jgi:hypothetical protein